MAEILSFVLLNIIFEKVFLSTLLRIVSLILMIYLYLTVSESNENERRETYHKSIINVIIESIRVITRNKRALHIVLCVMRVYSL